MYKITIYLRDDFCHIITAESKDSVLTGLDNFVQINGDSETYIVAVDLVKTIEISKI